MTTKTIIASVALSALPPVGTDFEGGTFAGITTRPDGTHCAVILLSKAENDLNWKDAKAWAKKQGGELPTRPIAALLFANVKPSLSPTWHWTADEYNASYAWHCGFGFGGQNYDLKLDELAAVAVRCIPLTA